MAYQALSTDECFAHCECPVRPSMLSTVRVDGRPHSTPMWYPLDECRFVFTTGRDTVKGRNLRRDPRLTLCLQDERPPFAYVIADGSAEFEDNSGSLLAWAARIGRRYLGADRVHEYGACNAVPEEMLVGVAVPHISGVRDVAN